MEDFKVVHVQDCGYTYTLIKGIVSGKTEVAVTDDIEKEGNTVFGGKLVGIFLDDQ